MDRSGLTWAIALPSRDSDRYELGPSRDRLSITAANTPTMVSSVAGHLG